MSKIPPSIRRKNFADLGYVEDERISEGVMNAPGSTWSTVVATEPRNIYRNRYLNVLPWDRTRVKLPTQEEFDYINASYITTDGTNSNASYILTQGPTAQTIPHFWAMCFNEAERQHCDVIMIIMMTPLTELNVTKCSKYWPDHKNVEIDLALHIRRDNIDLPNLKIKNLSSEYIEEGDYQLSTLQLTSGDKVKKVMHYYYYKWADTRTPNELAPLLKLSQDIRAIKDKIPNLVPIVHCSAGVGRSGTFIALDQLLHNKRLRESKDPVFDIVSRLRESRMMMVQTFYQLNFLYDANDEIQAAIL